MKRWSTRLRKRLPETARHQRTGSPYAGLLVKLTKDATKCGPEDHVQLRARDLKAIAASWQITLIASWFNYN